MNSQTDEQTKHSADYLRELVREYGGSEILAEHTGIPKTSIENWMYRKSTPNVVRAIQLCDELGVRAEDVWG